MQVSEHTRLAVLESRWWSDANVSMRGFFDAVADLNCLNPHAYHYEMVGCVAAAQEAIPRIASNPKIRVLCIAMHGDAEGLNLHNGDKLSRTVLRNCLQVREKTVVDGLYLSSCSFGTEQLARYLLDGPVETCVKWVAGYEEDVDWIDSCALDMLFFNDWIRQRETASPIAAVRAVAERMSARAGGLIEELGYGIYVRAPGTGVAVNLLARS